MAMNHELERHTEAAQNPLTQAIAEYRRGVRTPEMWTSYWRAKFQGDVGRIGLNLEVSDCNWTEEEIRRSMVDIHGGKIDGIMVPVLDGINLPILGRMYPQMQSQTVREDSPVMDAHETTGWIKVYAVVSAPNRNTGRAAAEKFASDREYLPGREKTYILGSQAKKDFRNEYFDQGPTWSWILGSQIGDRLVGAGFDSFGRLLAGWGLSPGIPAQSDGWRFEEVKK